MHVLKKKQPKKNQIKWILEVKGSDDWGSIYGIIMDGTFQV
jgi:hypothetical protein